MKYSWSLFIRYFLFLVCILFSACDRDNNSPGWDYFPDMAYSYAYETNSPNGVTADGKTMLMPVKGTVPREMIPFEYDKSDEEALRAGNELKNPFVANGMNIKMGKDLYIRFCAICHGVNGDGKGYLFTSGKFVLPPKSLVVDKVVKKKDGELYHNITLGWGGMGAYGLITRPEDRWKIILFLREIQKNSPAK